MRANLRQLFIHGFFRGLLQIDVNRQFEVITGNCLFASENLYRLARHIDFDLLAAVFAAQFLIIYFLQAELADDITGLIAFVLHFFQLSIVDFADIAKRMRAFLLQDVIADRRDFDDDAWVLALLFLDDGDNIGGDIGLDADGVKAAVPRNLLLDFVGRYL